MNLEVSSSDQRSKSATPSTTVDKPIGRAKPIIQLTTAPSVQGDLRLRIGFGTETSHQAPMV